MEVKKKKLFVDENYGFDFDFDFPVKAKNRKTIPNGIETSFHNIQTWPKQDKKLFKENSTS